MGGPVSTTTFSVDIRATGELSAVAAIKRTKQKMNNIRPWYKKLARAIAAAQLLNFTTEGSLAGGWAPLSPEYAAWRLVHAPGPIMVRTGHLMLSLTSERELVKSMTNRSMTLGSDVAYAHFHQTGTSHMPQRKVLVLPESVMKAMLKDLAKYVVEGRLES